MSGHWICDRCGYDGEHADYCVHLRPTKDQWKGHRTAEEMQALKPKPSPSVPSTDGNKPDAQTQQHLSQGHVNRGYGAKPGDRSDYSPDLPEGK